MLKTSTNICTFTSNAKYKLLRGHATFTRYSLQPVMLFADASENLARTGYSIPTQFSEVDSKSTVHSSDHLVRERERRRTTLGYRGNLMEQTCPDLDAARLRRLTFNLTCTVRSQIRCEEFDLEMSLIPSITLRSTRLQRLAEILFWYTALHISPGFATTILGTPCIDRCQGI